MPGSGAIPSGGTGTSKEAPLTTGRRSIGSHRPPGWRTAMSQAEASWTEHAWRRADLPVGLAALTRRAGLVPAGAKSGPGGMAAGARESDDPGPWIRQQAGALGVRVEAVAARYPKLGGMLRHAAPAVLRLDTE